MTIYIGIGIFLFLSALSMSYALIHAQDGDKII